MRYAQIVMGPAGCGKSTYCSTIINHAVSLNRMIHAVNLDPSADHFDYQPIADIRELIHIDDVMEDKELHLGPNGGLVFCMEYLVENLEWLEEQLGDADDDYILFDCPGQIELYTHLPVMRKLVDTLQSWNFRVCSVFLLDSQFMLESSKFFSGGLSALSCMISLEVPTLNVMGKVDLLNQRNREMLEEFLEPDSNTLMEMEGDDTEWNRKYRGLTRAIGSVLDDYSMIKFTPLDIKDEESISDVLLSADTSLQYGEDAEVKDRFPEDLEPGNGLCHI